MFLCEFHGLVGFLKDGSIQSETLHGNLRCDQGEIERRSTPERLHGNA